jgi:hypothetical protein
MDAELKVRENRLRRMAARRRWVLLKSRRRDPQAWDFSTYMLVDGRTKALIAGDELGYGRTLDEIEDHLREPSA